MDSRVAHYRVILLLGIMAVSWAAIFVRMCDAPAMVIASYRLGLSVFFLAPGYLVTRRRWNTANWAETYPWLFMAGIFLSFHFITWIGAVQRIPIAIAVTLSSTHPIFVGMFSWLILKEPPRRGLILGMAVVFLGIAAMGWPENQAPVAHWTGYMMALEASLFFSGYVMLGRHLRKRVDLMVYVLPAYGVAAIFLCVLCWIVGYPLIGYGARTYLMFVLLALVPTVIGHSTLNWALRYVSATLVAISVLGEPVGATILAVFLFGEMPNPLKILSGSVILFGIYVAARSEKSTF